MNSIYQPPKSDVAGCPVSESDIAFGIEITKLVYILQLSGILLVIPFFISPILNLVFYSRVKTSWVETHFKWQLKTFWSTLLLTFLGTAAFFAIMPLAGLFIFLFALARALKRSFVGFGAIRKLQYMKNKKGKLL